MNVKELIATITEHSQRIDQAETDLRQMRADLAEVRHEAFGKENQRVIFRSHLGAMLEEMCGVVGDPTIRDGKLYGHIFNASGHGYRQGQIVHVGPGQVNREEVALDEKALADKMTLLKEQSRGIPR